MLKAQSWDVARLLSFRDHHLFTARDLSDISRAVRDTGAWGVLTTEKDAVRLLPLRPLPVSIAAVPLEIRIEGPEPFDTWLVDRVRKARA
jgi:tetraacyldisaccharide-1-P 4'-kinase